jgi:hypothetical protein
MIVFGKPRRSAAVGRFEIRGRAWQVLAVLSLLARPALAQQEQEVAETQEAPQAPSLPEASNEDAAPAASEETTEERIAELTERIERSELERQRSVPRLSWNGYVDFGYFAPLGNAGAGSIRDAGNVVYPQYST